MKCENCDIGVGPEFAFAIKNNQCPACGKSLMMPEKLASYLSLQNLLRSNFQDLDAEKVASLVIANFELKQIFKEELPKPKAEGIIKEELVVQPAANTEEVNEDDISSDAEFKKNQLAESKAILKRMRDEVLDEAIADQWGLGNANPFAAASDVRVFAEQEKRKQTQENIVTGARGVFKRSE